MKVKINNTYYTVLFVNSNDHRLRESRGVCNVLTKEIFIDDSLTNIHEALIHEITHAVIEEYLLEQEWDEEKVALFIGKYLVMINDLAGEIIIKRINSKGVV